MVLVSPEQTYSPEDWETTCNPNNVLSNGNAVDLPLDIAPIAVGTGQQPKNHKTPGQVVK